MGGFFPTDQPFLVERNGVTTISQANVADGVNLEYQVMGEGNLKEFIIVNLPEDYNSSCRLENPENIPAECQSQEVLKNSFVFDLAIDMGVYMHKARDGEFALPSGTYYFTDQAGEYLFHFLKPYAYDANGRMTEQVNMTILDDEGKEAAGQDIRDAQIIVTVDRTWMMDIDRAFPIVIDPSIINYNNTQFSSGLIQDKIEVSGDEIKISNKTHVAADNIVGLWHFDEDSGTTIYDSSGNGNNGTATGTTVIQGMGGNARYFNGTSDYISIPDNSALDLGTGDYTISFWARSEKTADQGFVKKIEAATDIGWEFWQYDWGDGAAALEFNETNGYVYLGGGVDYNKWNHFTVVRKGETLILYINGLLMDIDQDPNIDNSVDNSEPIVIGRSQSDDYLLGAIDELVIYDTALSEEQIGYEFDRYNEGYYVSDIFDLGSSPTYNNISWTQKGVRTGNGETIYDNTDLVGQWNFNEASGTTATDSSGNGNNGTLVQFADTSGQDVDMISGWTADRALFGGGALMFDSRDNCYGSGASEVCYMDEVQVPHSASLYEIETKDQLAVEAWVNIHEDQEDWQSINFFQKLDKGFGSSYYGYSFYYTDSEDEGISFVAYDPSNGDSFSWNTCYFEMPTEKWTYVAMSYDRADGYIEFFVDGQKLCQNDLAIDLSSYNTKPAYIGGMDYIYAWGDSTSVFDSVRVYSRTLTPEEILSNYQAGNAIIETRTGPDNDPNSGNWEAWSVVGSNTQTTIDAFDSSAGNWSWDPAAGDITKNKIDDSILKYSGSGSLGLTINTPPSTTNANRLDLYDNITSTNLSNYSYLTLNTASDTTDQHTQLIIGESTYVNNEADSNTVGMWRLDETAGSGDYIKDYSGNGYDGTPTGTSTETGRFGLARTFDGTGENIDAGAAINPGNEFTIEAWVKGALDPGTSPGKAGDWVVNGSKVYYIYTNSNYVYTGSMNTDGTGFTSNSRAYSTSYRNRDGRIAVDPAGKVYYVWQRYYTPSSPDRYYIASAEANQDDSGFTYSTHTIQGAYNYKTYLNISVGSSKVFYAWVEDGDIHQGELIISSSSWSDSAKTVDALGRLYLNMQVANGSVYYSFVQGTYPSYDIYTYNTPEGTPGWAPTQRTSTTGTERYLSMTVTSGGADYYVYNYRDTDGEEEVWTSDSAWSPVQQMSGEDGVDVESTGITDIEVYNSKVYYVGNYIYRADTDGTNWEMWMHNTGSAEKIYINNGHITIWSDDNDNLFAGDLFGTPIVFENDSYAITLGNEYIGGTVEGSTTGTKFVSTDFVNGNTSDYFWGDTNRWNYVVMTADGANLNMYLNGQLVDQKPFAESIDAGSDNFKIGNTQAINVFTTSPVFVSIDEVQVSDVARTPEEILQKFNIDKRTYNLNYNFEADLDAGNLIANSSDLSFTIDATGYGLPTAGANIYVGEKIIITEGTDKAQGTVATVNESNGAITVVAWDTGSTFPGGGYTTAADVFKWQEHIIDLGMIPDSHINAVDRLTITGFNHDTTRNIWFDSLVANTQPSGSTINSTEQQYFQYRVRIANSAFGLTPSVTGFELDYTPSGTDPISIDSATTSETELNNDNIETFNIQAVGVDVAAVGETVTCQASWDNQATWNDFATSVSPLTDATVQNDVDLTTWNDIPDDGTVTFYVRCYYDAYSSNIVSFNTTKDTSPPEPGVVSIVSVAGDTAAPYYDNTDDASTAVVYTTTVNTLG